MHFRDYGGRWIVCCFRSTTKMAVDNFRIYRMEKRRARITTQMNIMTFPK